MTASKGNQTFVSRIFAPQSGIPEDPATGSAHAALAPFWAAKNPAKEGLWNEDYDGKSIELTGRQLSSRGAIIQCRSPHPSYLKEDLAIAQKPLRPICP